MFISGLADFFPMGVMAETKSVEFLSKPLPLYMIQVLHLWLFVYF